MISAVIRIPWRPWRIHGLCQPRVNHCRCSMVTLLQSSGISGSYNRNIPHLQEGYNQFTNHLPSHIQALLCFHFPCVGTVSPWTAHVQRLYCWPLPSRLGIGNAPWVKMGGFCQIKRTHLLFGSFVWFFCLVWGCTFLQWQSIIGAGKIGTTARDDGTLAL